MVGAEAIAETWAALRTDVTRFGDSCVVSNPAIPKLERFGADLPAAVEAVVASPEFEAARQVEWPAEPNTLHLLLVYFEQADDHGHDAVPFLRSLRGPVLHEALVVPSRVVVWAPGRDAADEGGRGGRRNGSLDRGRVSARGVRRGRGGLLLVV